MTTIRPQERKYASKTPTEPKEVRAPGSATVQVVEPGVTYSFNIVLDKAGSTAIAQFHLPLSFTKEEMLEYTAKALSVIEMQQLRFDRDKLKVEIKLTSAMLDNMKEDFVKARANAEKDAKLSSNGKLAKPVNQQLIALDNDYRNQQKRYEAMQAELLQMEKRLGANSSPNH
jgi:hypothetical protein